MPWNRWCPGFKRSDPAIEDALSDVPAFRDFVGLAHWNEQSPSEWSIVRFRHLLGVHEARQPSSLSASCSLRLDGPNGSVFRRVFAGDAQRSAARRSR